MLHNILMTRSGFDLPFLASCISDTNSILRRIQDFFHTHKGVVQNG